MNWFVQKCQNLSKVNTDQFHIEILYYIKALQSFLGEIDGINQLEQAAFNWLDSFVFFPSSTSKLYL